MHISETTKGERASGLFPFGYLILTVDQQRKT